VIGFNYEQYRAMGLVAPTMSALIEFWEALFFYISSELIRYADLTAVLNAIFS